MVESFSSHFCSSFFRLYLGVSSVYDFLAVWLVGWLVDRDKMGWDVRSCLPSLPFSFRFVVVVVLFSVGRERELLGGERKGIRYALCFFLPVDSLCFRSDRDSL